MSAELLCVFEGFILNEGMTTLRGNVLVAVTFLSYDVTIRRRHEKDREAWLQYKR